MPKDDERKIGMRASESVDLSLRLRCHPPLDFDEIPQVWEKEVGGVCPAVQKESRRFILVVDIVGVKVVCKSGLPSAAHTDYRSALTPVPNLPDMSTPLAAPVWVILTSLCLTHVTLGCGTFRFTLQRLAYSSARHAVPNHSGIYRCFAHAAFCRNFSHAQFLIDIFF